MTSRRETKTLDELHQEIEQLSQKRASHVSVEPDDEEEACLLLHEPGKAIIDTWYFCKTIRISTMHVLRMIVAKAEETHGLRINFVLCFSTLVFYITTENLLLPLETRSLSNFAPHGM